VPGRAGPAYASQGGLTSAWRVVMMADRAGDLIPSHLIGNLNPPPQGDFSWVKPGKAAWDWWSGPLVGMKPDMTAERTKRGHDGRFAPMSAGVTIPLVQNVERGRCQNKRSHAGERDGR